MLAAMERWKALHRRLEHFAAGDDYRSVLDAEADRETASLLTSVLAPRSRSGPEDRAAVGWFYWCRFAASPPGEGEDDLRAAAAVLAPLFRTSPENLPDPIREHFTTNPEAASDTPGTIHDNAMALLPVARRTSSRDLVAACLQMMEEALAGTAPGDPDLPVQLSNLGMVLFERYEQDGEGGDLSRALEAGLMSVASTPPDSPQLPLRQSNLVIALHARYKWTGEPADLDEAVEVGRKSLRIPMGDPRRPTVLMNLTPALISLYERSGQPTELQEALALAEDAVRSDAAADVEHPGRLTNLALGLRQALRTQR